MDEVSGDQVARVCDRGAPDGCQCFREEWARWILFSVAMDDAVGRITLEEEIPQAPPLFQPTCARPSPEVEFLVSSQSHLEEQGKGFFASHPPFRLALEQRLGQSPAVATNQSADQSSGLSPVLG